MCMTYSVVHGSNYLILYVYYYKDSETKDTCCSLPFALLYLIKYACCSMNNSSSQNCTYFNQESRITLVTAIRAAVRRDSLGRVLSAGCWKHCFIQEVPVLLSAANPLPGSSCFPSFSLLPSGQSQLLLSEETN